MALRTYLPKLAYLLHLVCGYINRWEDKIRQYIGEEGEPLLDAVLTACTALDEFLDEIIPQGT